MRHCPPQNPASGPPTTPMPTEMDLRRLSTPVPRCDGRHMVASQGSPIERHPNIRAVRLDLAGHVMLTVRLAVITDADVPAHSDVPATHAVPPTLPTPARRRRWTGCSLTIRAMPSASKTQIHGDTLPSPLPYAAEFTLTFHPPVANLSISLLEVVHSPDHRRCQNAIAKRATCHTLSPPAVNANCFPRRSRAPAPPHSGLAHDPAVPSPLTFFLCPTPALRSPLRDAD